MRIVTRVPGLLFTLGVVGCAGEEATGDAGPGAAETAARPAAETPGPARHLFVWAGDADRADSDFLAVLDADPESSGYGRVLTTLPVGRSGSWPHHTEHRMPRAATSSPTGSWPG